jgi:predicted NBD/HSP70 family sugar kinase
MVFTSILGANNRNLKSHNVSAILLTLLNKQTISRAHLAQTLGVSNATISNLINDLSDQGLVEDSGIVLNEGNVGRPQREIQLVAHARYAIGVHFDVGTVYIGITNLAGDIIVETHFNHGRDANWQTVLDQVINHVSALIAEAPVRSQDIVGIGVGASGLVNVQTGVNVIAPNLYWYHVPIADYLQERLDIPTMVDNNVRAMALGEAMFGIGSNVHAMAFIYGRVGVGAGLVVRGQLFRGAGAGAGEIGHTMLMLANATHEPAPQPLEQLVSESAILALAHHAKQNPTLTLADVFNMARADDPEMLAIIADQAFYIGIASANLINIFNPEMIILGGIFHDAQDMMLPKIEQTMRDYAFADLGTGVELAVTSFGKKAGMIGSAALALDVFFYRPEQQLRI